MPSQAKRELDRDADLVFEIMRLRAYARAKHTYDQATLEQQQKLIANPLIKLVQEFEYARAGEILKERRRQKAARG